VILDIYAYVLFPADLADEAGINGITSGTRERVVGIAGQKYVWG